MVNAPQEALPPQIAEKLRNDPPAKVYVISLDDETISPAFRGKGNDAFSVSYATVRAEIEARDTVQYLIDLLRSGEGLTSAERRALTPELLAKVDPGLRAKLLHQLLALGPGESAAAGEVLKSLDYGQALSGKELAQLFGGCPCCAAAMQVVRIEAFFSIVLEVQGVAQAATDSFIRGTMIDLIKTIADPKIRERFLDEKLSEKQLLEALKYLTSDQRLSLFENIYLIATIKPDAGQFLLEHTDNMVHYLPIADRVELVKRLMADPNVELANEVLYLVLRSAESLDQLSRVVQAVGVEELLARGSAPLNEFVAHTLLTPALRGVEFPKKVPASATPEEIAQRRAEFEAKLAEIIAVAQADPRIAATQVAVDAIETATRDLAELKGDFEANQDRTARLIDRLNVAIELARLEFRYGVNLSTGEPDFLTKMSFLDIFGLELGKTEWRMKDIADLKEIFSNLPEGHLMFTGKLREIEIVPFLGLGVLGARYHADGKIKIAQFTLDNLEFSAAYRGKSPLVIVLTHEIGHGIQIGEGPAGIYRSEDGTLFFGPGEFWFDFDDFYKLSGWDLVRQERVAKGPTETTVTVDGKIYPIGKPVEFESGWVVFYYHESANLLIKFDAYSDFSSRDYAKASPWEDFAEAFSEYIHLPERLIADAPEKFLHLELEFHKYEGDAKLAKLLEDSLVRKAKIRELLAEAEKNRKKQEEEERAKKPKVGEQGPKQSALPVAEPAEAKIFSLEQARLRRQGKKAA